MTKAIIYMTANQTDITKMLQEAQQLNEYAAKENWTVVETIAESPNQPVENIIPNIYAKVNEPFDVILISRKAIISTVFKEIFGFVNKLAENNISLFSIEEGNVNESISVMSEAFQEAQRKKISERTFDVRLDSTMKGAFTGGTPPFGYKVTSSNHLILNPEYAPVVQEIFSLYDRGLKLVNVARYIGDIYGLKNERKGEKENAKTGNKNDRYMQTERLIYILSNNIYCGYPTFNRTEKNEKGSTVPAPKHKWIIAEEKVEHFAIIDEELFYRVQEKLAKDLELPLKWMNVYKEESAS